MGLASRGRYVVSGEFATEKAVKTGKACLCIIAEDASGNTKKKFGNMCAYYQVPYEEYGDKASLGHALGQEVRTSLAILDEGFASSITEKIRKEGRLVNGEDQSI